MTDTSPTRPLEVDARRPLEPAAAALLQAVGTTCAQLDTAFVVAGATARDILMWHVHGIRPVRATRDVDVAVCAVSWPFHERLVDALVATGQFARAPKHQQKLLFDSGTQGFRTELDLVPFGPLEAPPGEIAWPPRGDFVLNVLGFQEAVDTALAVSIGADIAVPVASVPALALLSARAPEQRRVRPAVPAHAFSRRGQSRAHLGRRARSARTARFSAGAGGGRVARARCEADRFAANARGDPRAVIGRSGLRDPRAGPAGPRIRAAAG